VIEQKVDAPMVLESQTFEGGALGSAEQKAANPPASQPELRRKWLRDRWVAVPILRNGLVMVENI